MTNNTIPNVPRDFTKRPVIIQAIKWTGDNLFDVIKFMSGAPSIGTCIGAAKWEEYCDLVQDSGLIIKTLEGQHIATVGDMIIRGVKGEFYPCKPDIFDMTYELSAPSPAGVDGLSQRIRPGVEAAPWVCDEVKKLEAIIDGLRGENEAFHAQVKVLQSDANSWQSGYDEGRRMGGKHCAITIDQQAQRIGELEGLLRDSAELIKHGVFEDGICCCGSSVDSHGLGDGHSPVDALAYHAGQVCERIDAALSAGKDGE